MLSPPPPPPRCPLHHRPAAALLLRCPPPPPCCHAAALVSPPPLPSCRCHRQHPRPRHHQSTPLPSPPPPPAATATANATPIALATATAKTALAPALVNVTGPRSKARRAGMAPSPPRILPPLVVGCRCTSRSGGRPPSPRPRVVLVRRGGIKDDDGRHRRQPLSPITVVVLAAVAAAADACVSNAPVDGWLWCRLSPLAYCVVRRPNLSAPAIVRSSTLSPPGRRPLFLTIASHCTVALLPSINRFHRSR